MFRKLFFCATLFSLLAHCPTRARSAGTRGKVIGTIELPPSSSRSALPPRCPGFVPRAKNPLRPPKGHDPRAQIVVVLFGGPANNDNLKIRDSKYHIIGQNFENDILPVVVGKRVMITNQSDRAPRLYSQSDPEIVPNDPINRTGDRYTKVISEAHREIDIRDHDSVHFLAHIVAFDHPYFSTVSNTGHFEITSVPVGTWQIRIWYDGGWVNNIPRTTVSVGAARSLRPITIVLPGKLTTEIVGKKSAH